ncbi:MAG: large conductance mechanosensitive channel protein MscL [Tessaracoccus sp.]
MKGFKEFLLRGNLIELAVAFIMAAAFTTVVESFTAMLMDVIGLLGDMPDFSSWNVGGVGVGTFLTALVSFLIMAAVVYFGIVMPYNKARAHFDKSDGGDTPAPPTQEELLSEIRDLLKEQKQA